MRDEPIDAKRILVRKARISSKLPFLRILAVALMIVPTFTGSTGAQDVTVPKPERERLERWVRTLADPGLEGRTGAGARKAGALLQDEFRRLGLEPLFGNDYVQLVPTSPPATTEGRNIGAVLRGNDPTLREQVVILSAHYDHLGRRGGVVYPGADDNASAVAMMLETARTLVLSPQKLKRTVAFIGFDQEELGLYGSRYYAAHPPIPLEKTSLFITADLLGRSFAGVCKDDVFVMGTEHIPSLRTWITEESRGRPLKPGFLGADILVLDRSDYGPFRARAVPFLFFSTGESPQYHTPADTADTIDYPKLTEISGVIQRIVARAADSAQLPSWTARPVYSIQEAETIRDVLKTLERNRISLKLSPAQLFLIGRTLAGLDVPIARGTMTDAERSAILQAARIILFTGA